MLTGWDDADDDDLLLLERFTTFDASINARNVATRDILFQCEGLLRITYCWFTCTDHLFPRARQPSWSCGCGHMKLEKGYFICYDSFEIDTF
jgi:hypothetical protein